MENTTNIVKHISIHVPRVEDDQIQCLFCNTNAISIHVPRVEDDALTANLKKAGRNFNPRPPCGGRRMRSMVLLRLT